MIRFAHLLDSLLLTPARNAKLRLMEEYFRTVPDPDRGWALAALTGALSFPAVKPAQVRALAESRVDAELFRWSYDFVGDLAETVALIWPTADETATNHPPPPSLSEIVGELQSATRAEAVEAVARWLDLLDATGRWALLKLVTGGMRVGVSARLAKTAVASLRPVEPDAVEEIWHGLEPPYSELFRWLEGKSDRPHPGEKAVFVPLMLANPIEPGEMEALDPTKYLAEWKWDGIRVQLAARGGQRRVFSRMGDDISGAFPEIAAALADGTVLDGELLVVRGGEVAPFNDLQQRLNRKTVTAKMLAQYPAFVRLYDALFLGGEDLRSLPLLERRARLEAWYAGASHTLFDLSPLILFASWSELEQLRADARSKGIEGLMLKRRDAPYVSGRPKGPWFKWKRDALTFDAVLMYAQRGHGKRSSFYSDYTFGAWRGEELVPVGKAYSGFTDEELVKLDRWVRNHTVERFGPVRSVEPGLVLEIAFDSVHESTRHKSGLAMRFPRVHRIRWDKPAKEADTVENLAKLKT